MDFHAQTVNNKLVLDSIPNDFKDLKKLEKVLISERILFKKIAIIHGKAEFSKIKGRFATFPWKLKIYAIFYQGQQFPMD